MGLMGRRRPLLRKAAMGAGAYYMGKHRGEQQEAAAPPPPPAPAPRAEAGASNLDQLEQLGRLHEQGVLTDDEFAQQKAKVLAG